jgi:hypothetical protein
VAWLFTFPIVLIGSAAILSFVFVRLSSLSVTKAGVEIRNYPAEPLVIPLDQAERFVPTERVGFFSGLRPHTAALLLADGSRVPVRSLRERNGAHGVDALNARLTALRFGA